MRTVQRSRWLILILALAVLFVSCRPQPGQAPEVSASEPPASIERLPEATFTPAPPAPGEQTFTTADQGRTVTLHVGDQFTLALDAGYLWSVSISDETLLQKMTEEVAGKGGAYRGQFRALEPGQVELTAGGDPLCLQANPPCMMPSQLFRLIINIE